MGHSAQLAVAIKSTFEYNDIRIPWSYHMIDLYGYTGLWYRSYTELIFPPLWDLILTHKWGEGPSPIFPPLGEGFREGGTRL